MTFDNDIGVDLVLFSRVEFIGNKRWIALVTDM